MAQILCRVRSRFVPAKGCGSAWCSIPPAQQRMPHLRYDRGTLGGTPIEYRRHFSANASQSSAVDTSHTNTVETSGLPLYGTPGSATVFSDINRMDSLSPRQLRVLLQDAVTARVNDRNFWVKASACSMERASQFKFFDALYVLECFAKAHMEDRTLITEIARHLVPQVSQMEIRHYIQTINVFGQFGKFPQQLFMEVFYGLMRDCEKMYGHEFAEAFLSLERWEIRNPQLLVALCRALCKNISLLRYPQLCQVASCARSLEVADQAFYFILDEWQQKDLKMMTLQELLDAAKTLRVQEVKWEPYEDMLIKEFIQRSKELNGSEGIKQLADPFDCLNFLRLLDSLSQEFLLALSKWCADAVHMPPTRSQKRPESHQLVQLYDMTLEHNVDKTYIDKAILKFVTSKGGLQLRTPRPIPTQYKPNRKYVYADDPSNPSKRRPALYLSDEDIEDVSAEEAAESVSQREESEIMEDIIDELEGISRSAEVKKPKKPSTQSCGKASFRLKPKTSRHKNVAATHPL